MNLALLLALQAAAPPAPAAPAFDLRNYRPSPDDARCGSANGQEIIVCGRRGGYVYPLEEMERLFKEKPIRAEVGIAPNTSLRAYGDQVGMPDGQISKRAMVGVKLKF